jgi:hypothetical protein
MGALSVTAGEGAAGHRGLPGSSRARKNLVKDQAGDTLESFCKRAASATRPVAGGVDRAGLGFHGSTAFAAEGLSVRNR